MKTYIAKLDAAEINDVIVTYLARKKITIVKHLSKLGLVIIKSEVSLTGKKIKYLKDVEEDRMYYTGDEG